MAITITITPKEMERQAGLCFVGKPYRVFLVSDPTISLNSASTVAQWNALAVPSTNGYSDATGTVGSGSYNTSTLRYETAPIYAAFSASGAGYAHDAVVVVIDDAIYPHSILRLSTPELLAAGQTRTYEITLIQDD